MLLGRSSAQSRENSPAQRSVGNAGRGRVVGITSHHGTINIHAKTMDHRHFWKRSGSRMPVGSNQVTSSRPQYKTMVIGQKGIHVGICTTCGGEGWC